MSIRFPRAERAESFVAYRVAQSATYTTTGAAVYVRGQWHSGATKATLSDIYLKEIAAPTP